MLKRLLIAAFVAMAPTAAASPFDPIPQTRLEPERRCWLGAYDLNSGAGVVITGDGGHPANLSYAFSDGRIGRLTAGEGGAYAGDGLTVTFSDCASGQLRVQEGERVETGQRLALIEIPTRFQSDGATLEGKLVLPENGAAQALAVWIEGSNNNPSTEDTIWAYELARRGVAVFLYNKRGTGGSGGDPTADFAIRAQDTAAAVAEAKRLAPNIAVVGVIGGSQGGWVAPLTATLTPLDFVIPAFAMAEGPVAQDQAIVQQQLAQAGFGESDQALARELTAITARIVRSDMAEGFPDLDAFKAAHAGEAWLTAIQPRSYTGLFLLYSTEELQAMGPAAAQGMPFGYEPRPIIESIPSRQLWLLGGADQQAPNTGTQVILREIQQARRDVDVVVYAAAGHGLLERRETPGGAVLAYAEGLFDLTADWISNRPDAPAFRIVEPHP